MAICDKCGMQVALGWFHECPIPHGHVKASGPIVPSRCVTLDYTSLVESVTESITKLSAKPGDVIWFRYADISEGERDFLINFFNELRCRRPEFAAMTFLAIPLTCSLETLDPAAMGAAGWVRMGWGRMPTQIACPIHGTRSTTLVDGLICCIVCAMAIPPRQADHDAERTLSTNQPPCPDHYVGLNGRCEYCGKME